MSERFHAALGREILSERGAKYRRTVLALAVSLIAVHALGDRIELQRVSFLGAGIREGTPRTWLLSALWLTLAYNAVTFAYYAYRDILAWTADACAIVHGAGEPLSSFPQARMYLGWQPANLTWRPLGVGTDVKIERWEFVRADGEAKWLCQFRDKRNDLQNKPQMVLNDNQYRLVRSKLRFTALSDCGIPALLVVAAVLSGIVFR